MQRASDWIVDHTESHATVGLAYYCFNPGTFLAWLREFGVSIPESGVDRRDYFVWWTRISQLRGQTGYVCMTNTDIDLAAKVEKSAPGDASFPRTDPRFQFVQSFGSGPNQVNLFRYDLKVRARPAVVDVTDDPARNIRVVAATYGDNCHGAHGNSTTAVAGACNGKAICEYKVDVVVLGDQAPGCGKDFVAEWTCGDSPAVHRAAVGGPGNDAGYGLIVTLTCEAGR